MTQYVKIEISKWQKFLPILSITKPFREPVSTVTSFGLILKTDWRHGAEKQELLAVREEMQRKSTNGINKIKTLIWKNTKPF